ncbi:MAG: CD225/dispanin family protein [Bernardetiaceae bacterium]|nr:CD225/dispanin family protein [Bernardetiaceae bacterium]
MTNEFSGERPPKNWLVESILVTIFCCLPFGIVGIINATKVESRFYAGDIEGAEQSAAEAKKWTIIGLASGGVFILLYIIFIVVVGVGSAMGNF